MDDVRLPPKDAQTPDPELAQPANSDVAQPAPQAPISDIMPNPAATAAEEPLSGPEKRPEVEPEAPAESSTPVAAAAPKRTYNVPAIILAVIIMLVLSGVAVYPALDK